MPGDEVRPTPDRLRESLFSILQPEIEGCVFVDAYAGTGSVGIEAISRGARHVIFIEKDKNAVELIKHNLETLGIASRARVIPGHASVHLAKIEADIVFFDPPYPKDKEYQAALEALETHPPSLAIAQHPVRFALPETAGPLERTRLLKQGDNALSFYRPAIKS